MGFLWIIHHFFVPSHTNDNRADQSNQRCAVGLCDNCGAGGLRTVVHLAHSVRAVPDGRGDVQAALRVVWSS